MMRRLDRYIFREILFPGLIALVALTFIVFLQRKSGLLLDIILRQSPTASDIWAAVSAILPAVLTITLPMAVLMGILTGFSRLSSDSEAIAMRAAGIPMRRILRPVLFLAAIAWAATLALSIWIAPQTSQKLRSLQASLALRYPNLELRPQIFYEKPGWTWKLLFMESQTGDGIQMRGILMADYAKDPDQPEFTFAESGSIASTNSNRSLQLTLQNSSRHIVDVHNSKRYEIFSFLTDTISIDTPAPGAPDTPPVTETSTRDLWEHLQGGTATLEETLEFHHRLALPFACFAFALVGFPLGVSTNRGGRSTGLVLSLILMFAYFLAFATGTRATGAGSFSPIFWVWLPNIAFGLLGIILLARSDRKYEHRIISSLSRGLEWTATSLGAVKLNRLNLSRWAYTLGQRFRLFRLLDAYVLRGFCFFFTIVLSVFASLFIVITLFELLPDIIRNKPSTSQVIFYFVFLLPQIFYWVSPLAVLLAILINLGTLTKTNEVLAVKAGAVSLYRLSLPLILVAALLSGVVYVMQDHVLPWTNQKQDEYHDVIKGKAPQTHRDPFRKLMLGSGNRIYHYTFFDPTSSTFANLSILTVDPITFQLKERLFAKRASWNGSNWSLEDGWSRRFSEDQSVNHRTDVTFDRMPVYAMDAPSYFTREVREADQMSYAELKIYVEDLSRSGFDVGSLTVDLYRKLSFPMVSFIMALIGVPFSFKTGRKGAFYGIGFCLAVGIIYWSTFELFGKLGGINQLSPFVAAWFPNIIFGASGFWLMLRVRT